MYISVKEVSLILAVQQEPWEYWFFFPLQEKSVCSVASICKNWVRLDGFTVNKSIFGFHFWVAMTMSWLKTGVLSSICISHTGQGKWVNYISFQSKKELPLLLRRWWVTFQGMSSRKFYTQQGVYISMNGKLQARSYEIITNSLTDLLSAQDLCKHQYTSAKIKKTTSHHFFPHTIHMIYICFLWKCIPCFLSLLCAEKLETRGKLPTWRIDCNAHKWNIHHCKINITLGRKKLPTCLWKGKKIKKPKLQT